MSTTLTSAPPPTKIYAHNDDPRLFQCFRTWWLVVALCLMAQENANILVVARTASQNLREGRQHSAPSATLLFFTLLLSSICVGLVLSQFRPTLRTVLKQKAVLSFVVLAFLSTLWSQDPQLTFRRATILLFLCGLAWFFATSYSPADQIRLLLVAGVILASGSIAIAILLPQYGLDSGGAWRGILGQKNQLGHSVLFLFSGLAFCPIPNRRRFLALTVQAILPIGLIALSQSKDSLILAILLITVRFYGQFFRRIPKDQRPFVLFVTAFGMFGIAFGRGILLAFLGRDSTLTGRTHEWAILIPFALKHFWLGYGYQAFWTGTGDSLSAMSTLGGAIHGADSGYLDTTLQLGLFGLALFFVIILVALCDFAGLYRRASVPLAAYWYAAIVLVTLVGSVVEGLFSGPGGASVFLFVVACAGLRILRQGSRPLARMTS
jgi:exopolysaccharide production protein ExoQ